jgi:hypothetical protein
VTTSARSLALSWALLGLGVIAAARPAQADSQERCIDQFEHAQRSRKDGALKKARTEFRACAQAACPAMVRKDCTDALASLSTTIPSIRVTLRDASGAKLESFDLSIDGEVVTATSEAIELDPGEHVLSFDAGGGRSVERRVTLAPGALNVPVVVELGSAASKTPREPEPTTGTPVVVYALSGVAVVGLAGFVGFGLSGKSTEKCKGSCSDSEIDAIHQKYLFADIGLGVAVLSAGLAGYFYLSRPSATAARERAWVRVSPGPRAASLSGGLSF